MPSLRSLLSDISPPTIGNTKNIFYVQNTSNSVNNGGCCLLWTVPDGITSATFEMWGGGAEGSGSRCCEFNGFGSTTGVYAVKTVTVTAGSDYTLCAAGSSADVGTHGRCCSCSCGGNATFITTGGTVVACAAGGCGGGQESSRGGSFAYNCCWAKLRSGSCSDYEMPGTGSVYIRNQYCHSSMYEIIAGGASSSRATKDMCGVTPGWCQCAAQRHPTCASFPGGTGGIAITCGDGYRGGQHGAAGMIKVSYQ